MSHTGSVGEKVVFCIRSPTVVKLKVKVCSVSYSVVHTDTVLRASPEIPREPRIDTVSNTDTVPQLDTVPNIDTVSYSAIYGYTASHGYTASRTPIGSYVHVYPYPG